VAHCQSIIQRHAPRHARALDHARCSGTDHVRRELSEHEVRQKSCCVPGGHHSGTRMDSRFHFAHATCELEPVTPS
jgi:hypothetical protein